MTKHLARRSARLLLVLAAALSLQAPLGPAAAAPAAPVIMGPTNGSVISTSTPPVSGSAELGTQVQLEIDGALTGVFTTTAANGFWTVTPSTPLADGPHTVRARAEDGVDQGPFSAPVTFTVDTTAPPAPVTTAPANGSTTGGRPTYTGTAEPLSTVRVEVDGAPVGTSPVNGAGAWELPQVIDLPHGPHALSARAQDQAGNTSPQSATITFQVDLVAPAAPLLVSPADGATTSAVPAYTGTAEPASTVTVRVDGIVAGTATADGAGAWALTQPTPLPAGGHVVTATATDAVGNVGQASAQHRFTVSSALPGPPLPPGPVDEDRDDDGLTNAREATLGTDPDDADTDGDRLSDGTEVTGTRIKDDFKSCGRPARRSMLVTSDPLKVDTDRDRIPDGTEVLGYRIKQRVSLRDGSLVIGLTRSNPRARDTDRDRLADGVERSGSANTAWKRRKTDPNRCDTDRGGASDSVEVAAGSDPTRAASGPRDFR